MIDSIAFKPDCVRLFFSGTITSKEIFDANTKLYENPGFESCKYQLWIFNSVDDFIISTDEIMRIAEHDRRESERNPNLKIAIISDSALVFGLGRMYEAFYRGGPWEIMVFYDLGEAEKWLNS